MLKKLFKETTIYAIGPQIPKIAGFFILPIITRDLTAYDYGIAALVTSYIGILSALKALGLTDLFVNYYYKRPILYKIVWRHLLGFLSFYSILFSLFQGLLLFLILPLSTELKLVVIILNIVPIVLFENINVFGGRYLQLKSRPIPVAGISAVSGLVVVFTNLFTISYLKMGYMGWFVSALLGSLVQFIFYLMILYKNELMPIIRFRSKYLKKYLRVSLPFVPNKYGHYLLNSSDRIVMDLINVSTSNIGLYNFGYNIGNYAQIVVTSFGLALSPFYLKLISSREKKDLRLACDVTNSLQFLFITATFVGALWMRELFEVLVSNDMLKETYNIAIIIVMMQGYAPMRFFFTNYVVFHEKTHFLWKITLVGGVINVILNIVLIPIFGILVAAVTTFLAMFYISVIGFYHPQYKAIKQIEFNPILWFVLSAGATWLVYVLKDIDVSYKGIVSLGVLIMVAGVLFKKKELIFNQKV